jgi:threonine dehydrogenase-like Zn-dependent dehydrogenase
MGAHVTAVANSRLRAEAALAQGAEVVYVIGSPEPPRDRDIVVLTANTWEAYRLSVDVARYCGRVSVLGFPGRGCPAVDFNPLDPRWFYGKQLTLSAAGFTPDLECLPWEIRFNLRRNLEYILGLMARGSVNLERIITHRLPWQRMQEAYELAREHSKSLMAAVFDWRSA